MKAEIWIIDKDERYVGFIARIKWIHFSTNGMLRIEVENPKFISKSKIVSEE